MEQVNPSRAARAYAILLCLLAALTLAPRGVYAAAEEAPLEYQVKAAFLLNFTKFVEWPEGDFADKYAPISICIAGEDPFGRALDQIVEGETVGARRVAIVRTRRPAAKACQVVFIGRAEKDAARILAGLGAGVLTVGEGDGFLREGGAIAFVVENRRVRFDINLTAAGNAALKVSSKLLNVARSVEK